MSKNKKWSATAKFEIALLAIKGETTLSTICQRYQVSPSQAHAWKKELLERGAEVFGKVTKKQKPEVNLEDAQRKLFEKIGQLTVERDFLKKSWDTYHEKNDDK